MAATHTISWGFARPGDSQTFDKQYTSTGEVNVVDEGLSAGQTNKNIIVAIDFSAVKSFVMWSDQACVVKTNSSSEPDDTITLKADVPYIYTTDSYDTFLITADVTDIYVTNPNSDEAAVFNIRCIVDATP